jgi:RNA polymerase sigma-70 factor (ECF subfamily)
MARSERSPETELSGLMARYQLGDAAAADELVGRLSPAILRFLSVSAASAGDAEDLLQECWMRIHRSRHTYRASAPVLPWIFAIARHTRLDGYRRRRRREAREVLVAEPPETSSRAPAPAVGGGDLLKLLDRLPESQREVIWMLKVSGMTLEQVARATSSTAGAIKQKAHRAYENLRRVMQE